MESGSVASEGGLLVLTFLADTTSLSQTVTVRVYEDRDAVGEEITLTHTAVIGNDPNPVTLRNSDVTVRVADADTRGVRIEDSRR